MQFLTNGLQPAFQDAGRFGRQALGINPDGVMDTYTTRILNILLQNADHEGVLEMHFPAPQILFEENTTICLGGADFGATLDNQPLTLYKTVNVPVGSHLRFTKKINGERGYLAAQGGFQLKKWLGSVSYNAAVKLPLPVVEKGVSVGVSGKGWQEKTVWLGRKMRLQPTNNLRFIAAPEFDQLTAGSKKKLQQQEFIISTEANRMGYRLQGEPLETAENAPMLSSAVTFGTMQLLPDGQIIVLMASHQTTGGYPRIGHIMAVDLPKLAQRTAGDRIFFQRSTVQEAEQLFLEREDEFARLAVGVDLFLKKT